MNQKMWLTPLIVGAALALGGCGILKKKVDDAAPSATAAAASVTAAPLAPTAPDAAPVAAAAPAVDDTTIPASQDFEDEAFTTVTAANFKAQLTTLTTAVSAK